MQMHQKEIFKLEFSKFHIIVDTVQLYRVFI